MDEDDDVDDDDDDDDDEDEDIFVSFELSDPIFSFCELCDALSLFAAFLRS
jgi:hypothetical protein